MTDLSIIIPVYNVEKYILECLNSLRHQLDYLIEIIIVDDGSTDSSLQIAKDFIHELPENFKNKFTLLRQSNQGVSAARNYGIQVANGKYITFIDSDDSVSQSYVSSVIGALAHNPELIQIGATGFFENRPDKNYDFSYSKSEGLCELDDDLKLEIFNQNNWFSFLRIYKREFFSHFNFPVHLSHFEDAYIVTKILEKAQSIYLINKTLYNYRIRENSATRDLNFKIKDKLLNSSEVIISQLIELTEDNKIYGIPLIHFFNIYIEGSKKYKTKKIAKNNWNTFAIKIKETQIPLAIIRNDRERFLLLFLNFGLLGHYLSKKIYKLSRIFKRSI